MVIKDDSNKDGGADDGVKNMNADDDYYEKGLANYIRNQDIIVFTFVIYRLVQEFTLCHVRKNKHIAIR